MEESILGRLKQEHQEIMHDLEQTQKTPRPADKLTLFANVKKKLVDHMNGEDLSIYRHFLDDFMTHDYDRLVHTSESEHHQIKEILQRLSLIDIHHQRWEQWFSELVKLVKEHCQEEEEEMFSEAKETFSHEELAHFTHEFEEGKHR